MNVRWHGGRTYGMGGGEGEGGEDIYDWRGVGEKDICLVCGEGGGGATSGGKADRISVSKSY